MCQLAKTVAGRAERRMKVAPTTCTALQVSIRNTRRNERTAGERFVYGWNEVNAQPRFHDITQCSFGEARGQKFLLLVDC